MLLGEVLLTYQRPLPLDQVQKPAMPAVKQHAHKRELSRTIQMWSIELGGRRSTQTSKEDWAYSEGD